MRILKINSLPSVKESSWLDRDYIMFYACFQLFEDCVEKENLFDHWRYEPEVQLELRDLYYGWWKVIKNKEDFNEVSDGAQEKLELLIRLRRYLWT